MRLLDDVRLIESEKVALPTASTFECLITKLASLVNQTTPSAALDVLHHQHAEGGSGQSGTVFMTLWNAPGWDMGITACSVVTTVCR